jgi:hypothetical protein
MYCLAYNKSIGIDGLPVPPPRTSSEKFSGPRLEDYGGDFEEWGKASDAWQRRQAGPFWSETFQWLPSEFLVDKSGEVKIASYINNLVPAGEVNMGLYLVLAEIFSKAVPLLNIALTDLSLHFGRRRFDDDEYIWWRDGMPNQPEHFHMELRELKKLPNLIWDEREKRRQEHNQKVLNWYGEHKDFKHLRIPKFEEGKFLKLPLSAAEEAIDIRGHQIQVLVKIGSIELTPEKPSFDGGKWHVEVRVVSLPPSS